MSDAGSDGRSFNLAAFVPYRLVVLGRMMSEQLGAAYAGEGITIPEWRVLAVIAQAPTVAARDVVAKTPMDKMAVSRAVASLETKGLIARAPAADRRVSALRLSAKGRSVFERVSEIALDYEAALLEALEATDARAFHEGLARLESAVRSAGERKGATEAAE